MIKKIRDLQAWKRTFREKIILENIVLTNLYMHEAQVGKPIQKGKGGSESTITKTVKTVKR